MPPDSAVFQTIFNQILFKELQIFPVFCPDLVACLIVVIIIRKCIYLFCIDSDMIKYLSVTLKYKMID